MCVEGRFQACRLDYRSAAGEAETRDLYALISVKEARGRFYGNPQSLTSVWLTPTLLGKRGSTPR